MFGKWGYLIFAVYVITAPFIWTYDKGEKVVKAIKNKIKGYKKRGEKSVDRKSN